MSLQVKRFYEYMQTLMQEGVFYSSIPYDYKGTDTTILARVDQWLTEQGGSIDVVSITGPLTVKTGGEGTDMAQGKALTVTVMYRLTKEPVGA